jgi:hypothetical protein
MSIKLKVTNTRVGFAHGLFKARAMEEGQQAKYGADFILTPESKVFKQNPDKSWTETTLKAAQLEVANEAWKGKGAEMIEDLEASKKSYRNGNKRKNKDGEIYEGYEDAWYVTAKSATKPKLFDRRPKNADGTENLVTEESGIIYSGCYVNVTFDLYANTQAKNRGIFAGLTGAQFVKDGDSFGGGGTAKADDFDDLGDGADADGMA